MVCRPQLQWINLPLILEYLIDFCIVFTAWRNHETYRIKSSDFSSNDKAEALHELMDKELKLLQTIDKLRNDAARLNRQSRTEKRLAQMAAPKAWVLSNGDKVAVETPQIIRAREIMELYTGLGIVWTQNEYGIKAAVNSLGSLFLLL